VTKWRENNEKSISGEANNNNDQQRNIGSNTMAKRMAKSYG
jgi:hypothetical protein